MDQNSKVWCVGKEYNTGSCYQPETPAVPLEVHCEMISGDKIIDGVECKLYEYNGYCFIYICSMKGDPAPVVKPRLFALRMRHSKCFSQSCDCVPVPFDLQTAFDDPHVTYDCQTGNICFHKAGRYRLSMSLEVKRKTVEGTITVSPTKENDGVRMWLASTGADHCASDWCVPVNPSIQTSVRLGTNTTVDSSTTFCYENSSVEHIIGVMECQVPYHVCPSWEVKLAPDEASESPVTSLPIDITGSGIMVEYHGEFQQAKAICCTNQEPVCPPNCNQV